VSESLFCEEEKKKKHTHTHRTKSLRFFAFPWSHCYIFILVLLSAAMVLCETLFYLGGETPRKRKAKARKKFQKEVRSSTGRKEVDTG